MQKINGVAAERPRQRKNQIEFAAENRTQTNGTRETIVRMRMVVMGIGWKRSSQY